MVFLAACQQVTPASPTSTSAIKTAIPPATKTPPFVTPLATDSPADCNDTRGQVVERSVPSKLVQDDIKIKVYLPPCYVSHPEIDYSVLYMLHGQTSPGDQWINLGLLTNMDELILEGKTQPFIIVLPGEERSNIEAYDSLYGDALVKEVIPFVDRYFQTCTDRSCRAIGGLSRGGNWAVHLGFEFPELFSAVGAHSAPLFYGEIISINYILADKQAIKNLPVFYLDVGDRDEDLNDVLIFSALLQKRNVPHSFNAFLGYHDAKYWSAHVADYLVWYNSQLAPPKDN